MNKCTFSVQVHLDREDHAPTSDETEEDRAYSLWSMLKKDADFI